MNQEINNKSLKYAKRNWSKSNLYFLSIKEEIVKGKTYYTVIMYMGERKVAFNLYNPSIVEIIKNVNPQEKIKVWFTIESREYKGKWYTNAIMKHIEVPRLLELQKAKENAQDELNNFGFIQPNDNF